MKKKLIIFFLILLNNNFFYSMDNTTDNIFIHYGFNKPDFSFGDMNEKFKSYDENDVKIIEDFINRKNQEYNNKSDKYIDVYIFPSLYLLYNRVEDIRISGTGLNAFVNFIGCKDYNNIPLYLANQTNWDIIKDDLNELAKLLGAENSDVILTSFSGLHKYFNE